MIAFLGGDPDRPFIAGVVPNAHKPSVVGERNHTQNIIRTGSNNQIVMEDQQGKEFIFMHTPNKKTGIYIGHPTGEQSKVYTGEGESDSPVQLFTTPSNADPASDATMEGVAVSLWQTTEGNAGLYVGGASWTEVAGNESTFVKGNVSHGYRGNYSLVVGTDTSETYHGFRSSHEKNGWYDTVEAGGKNEDITPYFYQNVHGNGRQTVDEDWEHKVTGKNTDTYGTWQTDVKDGTWTATIKGMASIESTSAGVIIKGSSKIDLQAPEVTIKGVKIKTDSGNFFAYSPAKHEFYAYKGATGVAKTDHAVIYQSAYGLKLDTAGIKVENSGAKKTTFGAMSNMVGVYQMHRSFGVKMSAAEVWNGLFKKT
jgi:type VI secretion system secreted protein VgrG